MALEEIHQTLKRHNHESMQCLTDNFSKISQLDQASVRTAPSSPSQLDTSRPRTPLIVKEPPVNIYRSNNSVQTPPETPPGSRNVLQVRRRKSSASNKTSPRANEYTGETEPASSIFTLRGERPGTPFGQVARGIIQAGRGEVLKRLHELVPLLTFDLNRGRRRRALISVQTYASDDGNLLCFTTESCRQEPA